MKSSITINLKKKCKKELKYLKNQNKMLYRISNKSGLCRELKNIKKIKANAPKKHIYSSSNSYISGSDSDSSLSSDSDRDEERQPTEHKEINNLDNLVSNNIKK